MKLFLLLFVAACADAAGASPCGPARATVERVIDGDTIVLTTGERVRYLLIDANEITGGHDECYAVEARTLNQDLVEGKTVELTYDEQCTDVYGRLLAYVSVEGRDVSSLLVERGYACVLYIPPDGAARRAEFESLQAQAQAAKAGMWGACSVVPCATK